MSPEEAIKVADETLFTHAERHLTDIQRMILCESLAGKGYESMKGYASQHIKNEGKKLWDMLSEALGETVSKKNFKGALEKRFKSGGMVLQAPQPSNYDLQTWAGREALVSELLPKLQGQTRLVWLTGISGIGKTALGECLASHAWKSDPSFQWIYVEILEGQSANFASVAAEILAKLGDIDIAPQELNNPEQLAKRLFQKLQSHQYWIQLDALERLLNPEQPTEFMDEYWVTFLQRCLTEPNLGSRLVLTAQAFPTALVEFGDRYPNVWTEVRLGGLSEDEQRLDFFAKRGVEINALTQKILTRITQIYEGHPLVLKVIAEDVLKEFLGDVSHYWQVYQVEFEQVARELQSTQLDDTEYNEALDCKVRERIRKSLELLPEDALELLCCSSVFRRPVPKKFWLAMISDRGISKQKSAYRCLSDRALIEKEATTIRQHNLIRSVTYEILKQGSMDELSIERKAASLWLDIYIPLIDSPNIEQLRGFLEAFYHFYQSQSWEKISEMIRQHVQKLDQLQGWGYYQEMVSFYSMLSSSPKVAESTIYTIRLGNAYYFLGRHLEALKYWELGLSLSCEFEDLYWQGRALGNLTVIYFHQANYANAIKLNNQYLILSRSINDRTGEAHALGGLGVSNHMLGNYLMAIEYYKQELEIRREIKDLQWEVTALNNLGASYLKFPN